MNNLLKHWAFTFCSSLSLLPERTTFAPLATSCQIPWLCIHFYERDNKKFKITSYARYSPIPDEAPTIQKTCPLTEPIYSFIDW